MNIRKATQKDITFIYKLIIELADFEKGLHQVTNTEAQLLQDFNDKLFDCVVAEDNKKIVGMSLYYFRYSTWKGKRLYLEDLIVTETYKNQGIGKALLDQTIQIAKETNCSGMIWQVLDWNTTAIDFYKKYKTTFDNEWINVHLELQ